MCSNVEVALKRVLNVKSKKNGALLFGSSGFKLPVAADACNHQKEARSRRLIRKGWAGNALVALGVAFARQSVSPRLPLL